jgi:hypothetical protein
VVASVNETKQWEEDMAAVARIKSQIKNVEVYWQTPPLTDKHCVQNLGVQPGRQYLQEGTLLDASKVSPLARVWREATLRNNVICVL